MRTLRALLAIPRWWRCRKAGHPTSVVHRYSHRRAFYLKRCRCGVVEEREVVRLNRELERRMSRHVRRSPRWERKRPGLTRG